MGEAGFRVGDKFFPFASAPKIGDAPLVEAVTGVRFEAWADRLEHLDQDHPDTTAMLGLMAIAVRTAEPSWSRAKVVQFLEDVEFDGLDFDAAKEEATTGPPALAPEEDSGATEEPSTASITSPEDIPAVPV
jgi:hypothetical protein